MEYTSMVFCLQEVRIFNRTGREVGAEGNNPDERSDIGKSSPGHSRVKEPWNTHPWFSVYRKSVFLTGLDEK
jgi:hypothetical protein